MSAPSGRGQAPPTTVQFGRLERRGVLLGLSGTQLLFVGVAALVAVVAVYLAGATGAPRQRDRLGTPSRGRHREGGGPTSGRLAADRRGLEDPKRTAGATSEVSRAWSGPTRDEIRLPGIAGVLTVVEEPRTGAALVVDRRAGTATAIARVSGKGFVLADPAVQDERVAGWGNVLATICHQPALVRVQVLHHGVPQPPTVRQAMVRSESWGARMFDEYLHDGGDRKETLIAVALRAPRGRSVTETRVAELGRHLSALAESLRAADLSVDSWVGSDNCP